MTDTSAPRFARVARALAVLADYPDGIPLAELAARLDATEDELRDEIQAFYAPEVLVDRLGGGGHEPVIEFVAGPGDYHTGDRSLDDAPFVRLIDVRPAVGAGTQFLSFGQLAAVASAGQRLVAQEAQNEALAAALEIVAGSVLSGAAPAGPAWPDVVARRIKQAGAERRRVRISYAMAWKAGVVERVIEPYRVIRTQRGWEIDAAVVDREGAVATFAASGVLSVEVLSDRFRRPPDTDHRIERHRRTVPVDLVVPHGSRWVVELHAESAEVIGEDEDLLRIRVHLLPPVGPRLGLILVTAGPRAYVSEPANLLHAGRDLARALLAHHGG